jgi:hypothetical protein
MQVFNMINSRKIHGEINIFSGIQNNKLFIGIWLLITGIQAMIILVSGRVFEVSGDSINGEQWIIAMIVSVAMFPVAFILKFVPDSFCPELGKKSPKEEYVKKEDGLIKRKSSNVHRRVSQRIASNGSR